MLTIRFLRVGKKNQPVFRIVVTDKKNAPKSGSFLEILGFYNPVTKEKNIKVDRIKYWLSVGAQSSDTVHNLLIREKIIEGKKISSHKKKKEKEDKPVGKSAKETLVKKDEAESPKKEPVSVEALAGKEEKPKEAPKKKEKTEEQPEGEKKDEKPKEVKSEEKSAKESKEPKEEKVVEPPKEKSKELKKEKKEKPGEKGSK